MADHPPHPVTLGDVEIGDSAAIVGYTDEAPVRRFAEMGFVPGAHVRAVRVAPLGDPIEYAVMGSRVAMRRSDADKILIERAAS
jgi:Fe2+ transport system protein FeoA